MKILAIHNFHRKGSASGDDQVYKRDTDGFVKTIKKLWNDHEKRRELGKNARKAYEMKYMPEDNYRQLIVIYEKIPWGVISCSSIISHVRFHGVQTHPVHGSHLRVA